MNAERLLAHFERISEAPDAISRLRRFILDLAVRGKLVEQDPDEATPAQNLSELRKQKDLAYAVEGLRARKPITAIKPTELWFDFPHSWMLCSFDDALVIVSGVTKGQRIPSGEPSVEVPYLRVANVQRGWLDLSEVKSIAVRTSDVDRYRLANQDILMTEGGDWDKLGRAAIWRGEITRCIHQNHIFRLRIPSDSILPEWVVLYANSECGRRFFQDSSKQTTNLASINLTQLRSCPIPLPTLTEQHRIVAKVDELMALCDQLEAARQQREQRRECLLAATLQRLNQPAEDTPSFHKDARFALQVLPSLTTTPAQIKQLRQTILNLAVRGKLVEQDPEDEPAEELLASFAEAKVEQRKRTGDARIKLEDDPSPESFPWPLPVGWMCQSFQNLFLFIDYRGNTPPKSNVGVPLMTAKNVRMGRLAREPQEFLSQTTFEKWMTRGFPRVGDLFFTTEAPLGNVCLNDIKEPFALAQRVICLQPYADINTKFIMFALMSDLMQSMIGEHATGLTAKGIKAAKLKPLPIPLPPLAEQHRIVAKVDELMALCDQLEQQLSQADQDRRSLLEALLSEALNRPAVVKT